MAITILSYLIYQLWIDILFSFVKNDLTEIERGALGLQSLTRLGLAARVPQIRFSREEKFIRRPSSLTVD